MGTTTEELKKLYAKLGGTDPNIPKASTPGEVLNGINELELGGDKLPEVTEADNGKALGVKQGKWDKMDVDIELPDVTTDDNGKVLMVSEGNWGKSDLPNNSNIVIYYADYYSVLDRGYFAKLVDANKQDVFDSVIAGKQVVIITRYAKQNHHFYLDVYDKQNTKCYFISPGFNVGNDRYEPPMRIMITYDTQDLITVSYMNGSVPGAMSIYSGKILQVNSSGEYQLVNMPTELPAVTASDNGSVLSVVDGAWAKAAASGGGVEMFLATFNNNVVTLENNKTRNDVQSALLNGKLPIIKVMHPSFANVVKTIYYPFSDGSYIFSIDPDTGSFYRYHADGDLANYVLVTTS